MYHEANEAQRNLPPQIATNHTLPKNMGHALFVIPLHKPVLDAFEEYSVRHSLNVLSNQKIKFIGPSNLDIKFYNEKFPGIEYVSYPNNYFESIQGYSRLLLSEEFYLNYLDHEFICILQPDAIVIKDQTEWWCSQPFDYIGAPWPDGVDLFVNAGIFEGSNGKATRAYVGNGGFCLRRTGKCLSLLQEFREIVDLFKKTGSSEDLFFSIMGGLSKSFILPNEIIASHFSLELKPSLYFNINGGIIPMGGHAWWKYEPNFWRKLVPGINEALFNNSDIKSET